MHQSQPLHCFSFTINMPVFSDWTRAFSGQAFTHGASSQKRQVSAKFTSGIIRIMRILDLNGLPVSPFSSVQAYSQIPQPVHLPGSTLTNFLSANFGCCMFLFPWCLSYVSISVRLQGSDCWFMNGWNWDCCARKNLSPFYTVSKFAVL